MLPLSKKALWNKYEGKLTLLVGPLLIFFSFSWVICSTSLSDPNIYLKQSALIKLNTPQEALAHTIKSSERPSLKNTDGTARETLKAKVIGPRNLGIWQTLDDLNTLKPLKLLYGLVHNTKTLLNIKLSLLIMQSCYFKAIPLFTDGGWKNRNNGWQ